MIKMDTSIKRIGAYFLDIVLVTLVTTLLINIKFINPLLDSYNEHYSEYNEITEDYQNKKIEEDAYKKQVIDLNYQMSKELVISNSITVGALIIYFGIVQYFLDGETLGKKVFKLKVVSNKDKKLNIGNYLLRMVILKNVLFRILLIVGVYFLNKKVYYTYSSTISFIESIMETIIIVMIILRKDNRGLHDLIAGTKVISLKESEVIEDSPKEIIEDVVVKEPKDNKKNSLKKPTKNRKNKDN